MKRILVSVVIVASYFQCLNAQTTLTDKTVYSFFSKPKKIEWIEHYKGRIDGINDIAVTLAYDGKSCKGLLTYLKSRERLRLEGELNGNELTLLEVDKNAAVTGQFEGYIEGKNIQLSWSNYDNSIGNSVFLTQVPIEELNSTPCGIDKWIRIYQGAIYGSSVNLILQKDGQNGLKGTAYFEVDNKSYSLEGEIIDLDNLNIIITDDKNKRKGTLEGVFKNENSISANFFSADGQRSPTLFLIEENLEIDCIEYADYVTNYDITFPRIPNSNFNNWMDNLTTQWVKNCQQYSFEARPVGTITKPEMRSSIRAYAWSDVDFYDKHFISGFMTFENTWTKGLDGRSFNFDLKKGQEISLKDIFKEGFDTSAFVAKYINEEIDQHELYHDYEFRKWLSKQDFPYFVVHKDGLAFCTPFDSVYGRQTIKIPFEKLKPFFKNDTALQYLMN